MKLSWQITLRKASKPLLFGLCGASGCLIAAILGELFLKVALPPAIASQSRAECGFKYRQFGIRNR